MREIYRHPRAERDLRDIWRYTFEHWGERQADSNLRKIDAAIRTLGRSSRGIDSSEVRPGYRRLSVEQHRVYYREVSGRVEIVRVLHARMDVDRQLDE